jgi:hypothetical protein
VSSSSADAEKAVLIAADVAPDASALGDATTPSERVGRLSAFYDPLDLQLRAALAPLPVEVERQGVLGSWTVRGPSHALKQLEIPGGPLRGLAVHIVADDVFYAL